MNLLQECSRSVLQTLGLYQSEDRLVDQGWGRHASRLENASELDQLIIIFIVLWRYKLNFVGPEYS